ncbi:MAG: hypothetical protein R3327_05505 [Nitrosopumilaceae archaeon]|nr:hypothetical protein [Nitrosopumilaceae archaeon]
MNSKIYFVIIPVAFILILSNALFGHLIYGSPYDQDINKYSIYVHLQPEWKSYPANILYDVTTVWSNPEKTNSSKIFYDESLDGTTITDYNYNKLESQNGKPFVRLNHEYSNCEVSWKPPLYRYAIDSIRNNFRYLQGTQLNNDPYVSVFPNLENTNYSQKQQDNIISDGFAQFIPICTTNENTSYEFAVSINDKKTAFDVYFIPSEKQFTNFLNDKESFSFYDEPGCFARNHQSYSGICNDISQNSGLLIVIPDNLSLSLTKITVSLHEKVI